MAVITDAELARLAETSRLKLSPSEAEAFRKDLNELLEYFSKINEVESRGEELYYVKEMTAVPRKDEPAESREAAALRSKFTREKDGFMMAPKSL